MTKTLQKHFEKSPPETTGASPKAHSTNPLFAFYRTLLTALSAPDYAQSMAQIVSATADFLKPDPVEFWVKEGGRVVAYCQELNNAVNVYPVDSLTVEALLERPPLDLSQTVQLRTAAGRAVFCFSLNDEFICGLVCNPSAMSEGCFQYFYECALITGHTVYSAQQKKVLALTTSALAQREAEFQTIFDVSPIGIAIATDCSCTKIKVNQAAAAMLRVSPGLYYSKSSPFADKLGFKVLHQGKELEPSQLPIQRAAQKGQITAELRVDILHNDRSRRHLYEFAYPLLDEKQRLRGAIGFLVDVTPLQKAEEQLERQLRELEQQNENKSNFMALLGHELRNPLAAIANAVQLLNQPRLAQHHSWAMGALKRQIKTISLLVDDLLDTARLAKNKLRLTLQPVEVSQLVRNAIEASNLIDEKNQELDLTLPATPLLVRADPVRLEQVVANLLTNASKYSDEGSLIKIHLREEKGKAALTIADRGIGIDHGMIDKIFDIYTQALPSHERTRGGLGLGLNLVKNIMELHGGSVTVTSPGLGLGSAFTIYIPLLEGATTEAGVG